MMSFFQFTNFRHQNPKQNKTLRESFQQKRILIERVLSRTSFSQPQHFQKGHYTNVYSQAQRRSPPPPQTP
jgi:hypothetical protein